MVKNYVTIEILTGCVRFKKGQISQVPEILANKKITRGEAKLYKPEIISKKNVSEKEVINKKNIE